MSITLALSSFAPYSIAAYRLTIGALLLYALLRWRGDRLPRLRDKNGPKIWLFMTGMGFFSNALPFSLLGWGQSYVTSSFAGVSMAAVPLFVLPLAHFFIPHERLSIGKTISFLLGFVGVYVLIGSDAFASLGQKFEALARLACVGATACYAIGSIITRLCPKVDLLALATGALLTGAMMSLPMALIFEGLPQKIDLIPLLSVIYLGLLPTGLAQILLTKIIRDVGPSFLSLVNFQVPVFAVLFGALFLREALPAQTFFALLLILSGIALIQWPAIRALFNRAPRAKG